VVAKAEHLEKGANPLQKDLLVEVRNSQSRLDQPQTGHGLLRGLLPAGKSIAHRQHSESGGPIRSQV
jgi:hypothetical protein